MQTASVTCTLTNHEIQSDSNRPYKTNVPNIISSAHLSESDVAEMQGIGLSHINSTQISMNYMAYIHVHIWPVFNKPILS